MSFSMFDKSKDKDQHSPEKDREEKKALIGKCLELLQQIKGKNEDLYRKLNRIYRDGHAHMEVPRKKLQGFYGQLMEEWNRLTNTHSSPTPDISTVAKTSTVKSAKVAKPQTKKEAPAPESTAPKAKAGTAKAAKSKTEKKSESKTKPSAAKAKAPAKKAKKSSK